MTKGRGTQAAGLLLAVMLSAYASADMRIKVESHYSLPDAPPGVAKSGGNSALYYVQGSSRRHDVQSSLGSRSAVIRHCDSGAAYYVDFGHKQFWEIRSPVHRASQSAERGDSKGTTAAGNPARVPTVTVVSRTVESGKPRVILGRTARHYVSTAKEFLDGPNGTPYAEETIDGWYWGDVARLRSGCMPEDLASQPLSWIGEPDPVAGAKPVFEHSGPSPAGLVVEETRTVRSRPSHVRGGWDAITTIESKVVEFSDAPLDPSLFTVPKGFREVPNPTTGKPK